MRYHYDSEGMVRFKTNTRGSAIQPLIDLPYIDDPRDLNEAHVRVDLETLTLEILPAK